jgi:precorrin-2/cobalt-factor-2 C20-methyltransferase
MSLGRLIGVGVGPGDPELMTLKAVRALAGADVVAHFTKAGRAGNARVTACNHLRAQVEELELAYPVTIEIPKREAAYQDAIRRFYDQAACSVASRLDQGRVVAVICEGDPLLYGSFMHLHVRLAQRYPTEVVPGVSGMSGCWSAANVPIAQGDDTLTVMPATLPEPELAWRLECSDAAVIIKLGRNLAKVRRVVASGGHMARAIYVERGTMAGARVMPLADKPDDAAPYFAVVLVPGWGPAW